MRYVSLLDDVNNQTKIYIGVCIPPWTEELATRLSLYQEASYLLEQIREMLQTRHTVSITHLPVTQEETEECTVIIRRSESIMDETFEVKLEEYHTIRSQLLQFIREIGR